MFFEKLQIYNVDFFPILSGRLISCLGLSKGKLRESWAETTKWPALLCVTWIAGLTLQTRGNHSTFGTWRLFLRPHLPRSRDSRPFRSTLHQKRCSTPQGQPPLDGVSLQTLLSCLPQTWTTLQGLPVASAAPLQETINSSWPLYTAGIWYRVFKQVWLMTLFCLSWDGNVSLNEDL